jgi:hypothetical protein
MVKFEPGGIIIMGRILIVLVALITMGTAAHATNDDTHRHHIFAAGPLYGGGTQNQATCYLYNAGNFPVSVSGAQIIQQDFGPLPLVSNNCTGALAAGSICVFAATLPNGFAHACKAIAAGDVDDVRGELDIRGGVNSATVLQVEQLR